MKIVFRGRFMGSPETWSFSTKWDIVHTGDPDGDIDNIDNGGVENALTDMFATASWQSTMRVDEWRAYDIGTDGKMQGNPRIQAVNGTTGIVGTGTAVKFPTDVSLCVTTEAENRGPARFGRFFLPGPAMGLDASYRLSQANGQTIVGTVTQFLKDVADSIDVPASPVSTSMVNISAVGTGTLQQVKKVRVGLVYDNISRRRRQLIEAYEESGTIDW